MSAIAARTVVAESATQGNESDLLESEALLPRLLRTSLPSSTMRTVMKFIPGTGMVLFMFGLTKVRMRMVGTWSLSRLHHNG